MESNLLRRANQYFNECNFIKAIELYKEAQVSYPELKDSLAIIIDYALENISPIEEGLTKADVKTSIDRFSGEKVSVLVDKTDPRLKLRKPDSLEHYFYEQVVDSGLFDTEFYLATYFEELEGVDNLLEDYLSVGIKEKRNPSKGFNLNFYLKHNPDVATADVNPFLHFVCNGRFEGREAVPKPYNSPYEVAPVEYVKRLPCEDVCENRAVRVICFYLPQFHAIPENDEWWGKGFTEWTNVKPALPQFEGHYQPHIPDTFLGYYNLLDKESQRKQIELAKQYGIEGFCYYLYWFSGQRLLEQPLDNMLEDKSLDLPFCVCWANENWSRRWDGLDNDLLMVQEYSPEDDLAFIENTSKYLCDDRYIKINGRPLLLVYRPNLFPDMRATVKRWRDWCRNNGIGEIFLAYPQSFESVSPNDYDFDGAVEFPPNKSNPPNITEFQRPLVDNFESTVFDWRIFVERSKQYDDPGYTLFRGVTPSWDNTARKKNKGTVFHNSCPKLFEKTTVNAFDEALKAAKTKDEQIVFVNAWNEWAEGAHLEPDIRYGYAWLQAIRNAHGKALEKKNKILLVSHDAHPHGAQILTLNLAKEFKQKLHFDVEMIVLGDGIMLSKFAKYATVHRFDLHMMSESEITRKLERIRSKSIDLALVNTTVSGKLTPFLKKCGYSVVSLIHELPKVLESMNLKQHALEIAAHADKIVFPAHQVQEGFEAFIGSSLKQGVIRPQGIYLPSILRDGASKDEVKLEVKEELGIPSSSKLIMCAGYADHRKGFDIFVKSALSVMSGDDTVYALWVGHWDKPFVDKEMAMVDKNMKHRFLLPGLVEDPRKYYVAADVYALTSREDPFPSVVMEALDALTPVVAFRDSGGFENLLSRECGLLVDKGNVSEYSLALKSILKNQDYGLSLARKGQEIVQSELSFYHYLFDLVGFGDKFLPKVSVVVPNYNYESYIQSRLESIINQTYPIYELIVLDDVSSDNSVSVIKEFISKIDIPTKFVVNEKNSGSVFRQWKKGAELAQGDLLWIAEADDLAEPQFVNKLVGLFDDESLTLAYSQSKQIDQNSNLIANDYLDYTKDVGDFWLDDYIIDGKDDIKRALCIKNTIPNVSGVLFNLEIFKRVISLLQEKLTKYKVAGDWLIYIEMLRQGKVAFCKASLNLHRRHISSVTKKNNHYSEVVELQDYACNLVKVNSEIIDKIESYRGHLKNYFELNKEE